MKRDVPAGVLTFLVREAMAAQEACRECIGGVVVEQALGNGTCNWRISVMVGQGCGDCLIAVLPAVKELQARFNLLDGTGAGPAA